jgi:hypothetical protein
MNKEKYIHYQPQNWLIVTTDFQFSLRLIQRTARDHSLTILMQRNLLNIHTFSFSELAVGVIATTAR